MSTREQDILAQIKQAVKHTGPTATAILFGSRATGKAKKDSDWDILILLDKANVNMDDELPIRDKLYDVELEIGEAISSLFYSKADWDTRLLNTPIHEAIEEDGVVL